MSEVFFYYQNRKFLKKLILKERFFTKDLGNIAENVLKMSFFILNKGEDVLTAHSLAGDPDPLLLSLANYQFNIFTKWSSSKKRKKPKDCKNAIHYSLSFRHLLKKEDASFKIPYQRSAFPGRFTLCVHISSVVCFLAFVKNVKTLHQFFSGTEMLPSDQLC